MERIPFYPINLGSSNTSFAFSSLTALNIFFTRCFITLSGVDLNMFTCVWVASILIQEPLIIFFSTHWFIIAMIISSSVISCDLCTLNFINKLGCGKSSSRFMPSKYIIQDLMKYIQLSVLPTNCKDIEVSKV